MSAVVIVTGAIGIGKTTICRQVVALARARGLTCGGILTRKSAGESIIVENLGSGETATLASEQAVFDGPRTERFFFSPQGITFGLRAIKAGLEADILFVDEIGPLELEGQGFVSVTEMLGARRAGKSVTVIRDSLLDAFRPRFSEPTVFRATLQNRDSLPEEIVMFLTAGAETPRRDRA